MAFAFRAQASRTAFETAACYAGIAVVRTATPLPMRQKQPWCLFQLWQASLSFDCVGSHYDTLKTLVMRRYCPYMTVSTARVDGPRLWAWRG